MNQVLTDTETLIISHYKETPIDVKIKLNGTTHTICGTPTVMVSLSVQTVDLLTPSSEPDAWAPDINGGLKFLNFAEELIEKGVPFVSQLRSTWALKAMSWRSAAQVAHQRDRAVEDYQQFAHGTSDLTHTHRHGYIDTTDRRARWRLG